MDEDARLALGALLDRLPRAGVEALAAELARPPAESSLTSGCWVDLSVAASAPSAGARCCPVAFATRAGEPEPPDVAGLVDKAAKHSYAVDGIFFTEWYDRTPQEESHPLILAEVQAWLSK